MKKILLLGRLGINIPSIQTGINRKNIELFSGTNLEDVKSVFNQNGSQIDIVIMGAGIAIESRLKIIEFIFEVSKDTTVHMKDWNSGPAGMLPFVNGVLNSFIEE
jgi:hypothetical protein|tara:strand:+ start:68 stop:382 length:315 start_codon:yes stop_codon:yes gene_type:complete